MKYLILIAAVLCLVATAFAATQKCPYDSYYLNWSGRTQQINGVTWYVMKCPQGHLSLSRYP
jgi:hypothetical protein